MNVIELTNEEYIAVIEVRELLKETDAALGAAKYKANISKKTKNGVDYDDVQKMYDGIKKVDRLKLKLKKGIINKKEFNKAVDNVRHSTDKYGELAYMIDRKGSKGIDKYLGARPNKSHVDIQKDPMHLDGENIYNGKYHDKDIAFSQRSKEITNSSDGHRVNNYLDRTFYPEEGKDKTKYNDLKEKIKRHTIQNYANSNDDPMEASQHTRAVLKAAGLAGKHKHDINTDAMVKFNQASGDNPTVKKKEAASDYDETDTRKDYPKDVNRLTRKGRSNSNYAKPTGGSKEGVLYGYPSIFASDQRKNIAGASFRDNDNAKEKYISNRDISSKIKKGEIKRIGQDSDMAADENTPYGRNDTGSRVIRTKHRIKLHNND